MPNSGLRAGTAVVAAVALAAGFLLIRDGDDGAERPVRDRLTVSPMVVRPNVLVDASGAVLDEFTGDCASGRLAYLCARVLDELLAADRNLPARGGLTIRTTVDRRLQEAAQQAIGRHVRAEDRPVAAQVMIVPGTGEIRAMATSRPPEAALAYQQGTTAMVYPLAAALDGGMRYDDGFPYADEYRAPAYSAFKNCEGRAVGDPAFTIRNRARGGGAFTTLRSGTRAAENTFFLRLTEKVGLCESVRMAQRLGLARADGAPPVEVETFALGVNEVDPVTAAASYATFAARGTYCEPRVVAEVRDGPAVLRSFPARCREALDPPVADAVTGVLADALERGPVKDVGRDAAGMAGDASDYQSAWYAGYTPDLAAAVALGVQGADARTRQLADVSIGGRRHEYVDSASIPAPIWKESMTAALAGLPETSFTEPDMGRFGGCRANCE